MSRCWYEGEEIRYPERLKVRQELRATVIPCRSPEFKVHETLGDARRAVSRHRCGAIYRREGGEWVKTEEHR